MVTISDGCPVADACAAERIHSEVEPGATDRVHVQDPRQVPHVNAPEVVTAYLGDGPFVGHASDAVQAGAKQVVCLVLDRARDVRVGWAAVRRVVLEAAIFGRIVGRRHHDPVGEAVAAAAVVRKDGVGHGGRVLRRHDHGVDPFDRLIWVYSSHTTELAARRARDRVRAVMVRASGYEVAARSTWSVVRDPVGSLVNPPADDGSSAR